METDAATESNLLSDNLSDLQIKNHKNNENMIEAQYNINLLT